MQHINDDMDDLLRNAAESYPLKIKGANWDSIASRLSGEEGEVEPAIVVPLAETTTGIQYRKYLLAMLLIPLGLILAKYAGLIGGNTGKTSTQTSQSAQVSPSTDVKQGSNTSKNNGTAATNKKADGVDKKNSTSNSSTIAATTVSSAAGSTNQSKNVTANSAPAKGATNKTSAQFNMHINSAGIVTSAGDNDAVNKAQSNVPHLSDLAVLDHQQQTNVSNSNSTANLEGTSHPALQPVEDLSGTAPKINNAPAPAEQASSVQPKSETPTPLVHHNTRKGRFYIGAFVAPDYTTVKYQPGSKVGFNSGGVVGYTFMKNVSIEAGIAVGRKYYTSDGKYFNSSESWMSNWGKILNISGYASLTEFPVNLKYDFKPSKDGNFFAAAGVVSYIVHQENYNYVIDKNGVIYTRDKTPIVATSNFLANANISAGYESSLGGLCNFRIEPYYRIPIKGIGIGGLPITSIGLNIGITKKFK